MGLHPCSAYELAEQMKRGFQWVWPRAERAFYYEAKLLAEQGYADAVEDPVGDRPRVMYSLTDKGAEALRSWLADRNPQVTKIESEMLGRLFFAEYGSIEDLRAAASATVDDGRSILELVRSRSLIYLNEGTEFPSRIHMIALAGKFFAAYGTMLFDYGTWVLEETSSWTDTSPLNKDDQLRNTFLEIVQDASRRLETG